MSQFLYWEISEKYRKVLQEYMTSLYEQNGETLAQICLEEGLNKDHAFYLYEFCMGDAVEDFFDMEWYAAEKDGWGE